MLGTQASDERLYLNKKEKERGEDWRAMSINKQDCMLQLLTSNIL